MWNRLRAFRSIVPGSEKYRHGMSVVPVATIKGLPDILGNPEHQLLSMARPEMVTMESPSEYTPLLPSKVSPSRRTFSPLMAMAIVRASLLTLVRVRESVFSCPILKVLAPVNLPEK